MKKNILTLFILAMLGISYSAKASGFKKAGADTLSRPLSFVANDTKSDDEKQDFLIVVTNNQAFAMDTLTATKYLNPNWMGGIEFPDGPDAAKAYGQDVYDGIAVIIIDDKKFPDAYAKLKDHMVFIKKHTPVSYYDFDTVPPIDFAFNSK